MAFEETEPNAKPPPDASSDPIPIVEDSKDQEDNASIKENPEVSQVVAAQTLHQEVEEQAKEDQGQRVDVAESEIEGKAENEAEGEIGEVEAKAGSELGAGAGAEIESQAESVSEAEEGGSKLQAETETEAKGGVGAELESQEEGGSGLSAESESEAEEAGSGLQAETDAEKETEGPRKLTVDDIKTAPMDFRFPTTNQAKHCFTRYIEYHKCVQIKGDDDSDCNKYARYYRSLCPGEWIDKWNEQRENGTFPGPL